MLKNALPWNAYLKERVKHRWRERFEREREKENERERAKQSKRRLFLLAEPAVSRTDIPGLLFASHWI